MGRRGPQPTPTGVLAMRGSWRAGKRKAEPQPPPGLPDAPGWLGDDSRQVYADLAGVLTAAGTVTQPDGVVCGLLAEALALMEAAATIVDKEGTTATGSTGQTTVHPAVKVWFDCWDRVLIACKELGLTPSSRVGLTGALVEPRVDSCFAL